MTTKNRSVQQQGRFRITPKGVKARNDLEDPRRLFSTTGLTRSLILRAISRDESAIRKWAKKPNRSFEEIRAMAKDIRFMIGQGWILPVIRGGK